MSFHRQEPAPFSDHRADREAGEIVYPVFSRRSGGLSVGINLFPDKKLCSFDCPYCEVFPFETPYRFSLPAMERGLRGALADAAERKLRVMDLCFSGNGEPTLSPDFSGALALAARVRDAAAPGASLVVITNGSTLGDARIASSLIEAARPCSGGGAALDAWVKVDAGTEDWYRRIDRGAMPYAALRAAVSSFVSNAAVTVQTMLCAVDGAGPGPAEASAWIEFVVDLVRSGDGVSRGVRRVHIYGKARPAPGDPWAQALPVEALEERASALRAALAASGAPGVAVSVFE
jgi:histidinol dehydrogenase